ncbi:MAG: transglycosylase domain-containing protein [Gammaproteobacteria bacterium]
MTQAMVKYLYFDEFRPGFMKNEPTLIAWFAVDPLIGKDKQLAVFINTAYLGHANGAEVRGFPSAAKVYCGKDFTELTDEEYLSPAAMLIIIKPEHQQKGIGKRVIVYLHDTAGKNHCL